MKLAGNELKQSLLQALKQSLTGHSSICVAYSGGLDSSVLLHLCGLLASQNTQLQLSAFHVHHGLSQNADNWLAHCASTAKARKISFSFCRLGLQKQAQQSLEAQAREARYQALSDYAGQEKLVLLAQHEDDQAETFLLQLKRGAGPKGLASMPTTFTDARGTQYARPLLGFSRDALASFASSEKLIWIEDESNQDQSFDRNFLRQAILPRIKARWPHFNTTVSRSALHCSNTQMVVNEYMALLQNRILLSQEQADIAELLQLSEPSRAEFLRFWLKNFISRSPSSAQVDTLLHMIKNPSAQSSHLLVQDVYVEKTQESLLISRHLDKAKKDNEERQNASVCFRWQAHHEQKISDSLKIVSVDESEASTNTDVFFLPYGNYKVDFGRMSLRAKMHEKRPSKSLKTWFQEWSISPIRRKQIPVLIQVSENDDPNKPEGTVVALYCADFALTNQPLNNKKGNVRGEGDTIKLEDKDVQHTNQKTKVASGFQYSQGTIKAENKLGSWAKFMLS